MVSTPGPTESSVAATVRRILLSGSVGMLAMKGTGLAGELPHPCIAGSCGPTVSSWVTSGSAQATQSGNTLTINQTTDRATLNWSSFNVSADGQVIFNQPASTSIALNRIFQDSPSRIFGQVQANGEIYLINPNGMVFGRTATVNAAGILASTLQLSDSSFAAGIASPSLLQNGLPALQSDGRAGVVDANGNPILGSLDADGRIIADPDGQPIKVQLNVQQGAQLTTTGAAGRVLLAGQQIENAGSITAPDGQVILAAGDKVYLQASSDPALRGLLVEVGASGLVTNAAAGQISTPRGDTTLIGMAVNQQGRISATTTVSANGSVRLLARGSASVTSVAGKPTPQATNTGTLIFGQQSVTAVTPELSDTGTAVDDQQQLPSSIEGMGHQVLVQGGSRIVANGGTLKLSAVADPRATIDGATPTLAAGFDDPGSQLRVESGAVIDLSGSDATLPMSRNLITVELRANELKDSPEQRDSAIRGQPLLIDARVGTPLGDVSGAIAAIPKTVAERTSQGGSAVLASDGDIVVARDAVMDVSGGQINYESGYLQTSQLVGADGKLYDVGTADPSRTYVGVVNPTLRLVDDRWGRTTEVPYANTGQLQPGYAEGSSAGTLQFAAPSMLLNGDFLASVVVGPYQRTAAQLPSGGSFLVGVQDGIGFAPSLDYRAPDVNFVAAIPNVAVSEGAALPTWMPLSLPTDYLRNGFTRTVINSNGRIGIATGVPLDLAPGSAFSLGGQGIEVDAGIRDIAGSITLATRDTFGVPGQTAPREQIAIGSGVSFDVSGAWINDSLLAGGATNTPLLQNAGSIVVKLGGSSGPALLQLGDDVSLLANGGAWYSDSLAGGRGGSISLLSTRSGASLDTEWNLGANIRIEGFGVANASGGSFTLDAPAIQLVQDSVWARSQQLAAGGNNFLRLGAALFSEYGFSQFRMTASRPAASGGDSPVLEVLPGTVVQPQVLSLVLSDSAPQHAGGGTAEDFSSSYLPLPGERQAASVSLAAGLARGSSALAGALSIDTGAVLAGDPGSSFSFSSYGNLLLSGIVRSPGGTISATVLAPDSVNVIDAGYVTGRRIELTQTGVIDVSGTVIPLDSDSGLLSGKVTGGGTISLTAGRGVVAVDAGSLLDLSGTSAALDLPTGDQNHPYQRQRVGSAAGSLEVTTREGAYLLGDIRATAGADDSGTLTGGSLSLVVSRSTPSQAPQTYPAGTAQINVTQHDLPVTGTELAGYAGVSGDLIARAGFDAMTLRALDSTTTNGGRIVLNAGLDLSLARQISLAAPVVALAGVGSISLRAPYVSIGDVNGVPSAATPAAGMASLAVEAGNVDLLGTTQLTGTDQVTLGSTGDIRLQGVSLADGTVAGGFTVAGDLTLAAARVYGSTGSQFTLGASGGVTDRISFVQRGASPGVPLSAGSSITVSARDIEQGGNLLAPFGSISLQATDTLNLLDGSLTSVSGSGSLVPYGYVLNGTWLYDNGRTATPPEIDALPVRNISLQSRAVSIAPSATVDISGGGDLYAYEWVPGTGGSTDALAAGARPGLYAVLPSLVGQFAPYDPQEYARSDLKPGDGVYLSGYGNLAAGFYPLLPARYALLPGAYLVSVVPGSAEYLPGNPALLRDGTPVIAGYRTFADTGLGSAQMYGIAIRPGSYGRALAEYTDYFASTYFPARALSLDLERAAAPIDAGSLSIFAGQALNARGIVKTASAPGGAGASISVSALDLAVVGAMGDGDAGTVDIAAATLDAWAPARLTLGGVRSGDADPMLAVTADSVTVAPGVTLSAPDLLLAAHQEIRVEPGATIATPSGRNAAGATPVLRTDTELDFADTASRSAAILSASDESQTVFERGPAGTAGGSITLGAGSTLATRGALNVDAPGGATANGDLKVSDADVALGAGQIMFADTAQPGALVIDAALQDDLHAARAITLTGNSSIGFDRNVDLDFSATSDSRLELAAPLLYGVGGAQVTLAAGTVVIGGGSAANGGALQSGTSLMAIQSAVTELRGGNVDLSGFSHTGIAATQQVVASGTGNYRLSGDLDVMAPRILIASDADTSIDVSAGAVRLGGSGPVPANADEELGGALDVRAVQITDNTTIQASSGSITLDASASLALQDSAVIDVAGRLVTAGSQQRGSQGGTVLLNAGGGISSAAASRIDLSGAGDSPAGSLTVTAGGAASLQGQLLAQAASRGGGGAFDLTAGSLADFSALNSRLESGGFSRRRNVHVSTGDLVLGTGERISAQSVTLAADAGQVRIDGTIDASATDAKGALHIDGGAGVTIGGNASLATDSTGTADGGGDITIGSQNGHIDIASTSRFSATGPGTSGNLVLSAPVAGTDVAINALPADLSRMASAIIAPIFVSDVAAAPTAAQLTAARQPATNFVNQNGSAVLARLNPGNLAVNLRPEIQLRRAGDLSLGAIDLSTWRFAGQPGILSVVATGDIRTTGNISDGFTGSGTTLALGSGDSTSISLAAGRDLTIGANFTVRTGTGNLSLSAGRDLIFSSGATAYTGGIGGTAARSLPASTGAVNIVFPDRGGDLQLLAGRDIRGSPVTQSVTDWQYRGTRTGADEDMPRLWGILLSGYGWNVGTLGGGDVEVRAGHDVTDLSAATADSEVVNTDNSISHYGGGSLRVSAGDDINSSEFFGAHGLLDLSAGGELGSSRTSPLGDALGSLLWMADTDATVTARTGALIESVLNPTALVVPRAPNTASRASWFFTYGEDASLRVQSAAGDVMFHDNSARLVPYIETTVRQNSGDPAHFSIYPPQLDARSFAGDISFERTAYLFPAAQGRLNLFARGDVFSDGADGVRMSDGAANGINTPLAPAVAVISLTELLKGASASRHLADDSIALIDAGRDVHDIIISVPTAAQLVADRDVSDVTLISQNLEPQDVTLIQAGRDITFGPKNAGGQFLTGGPGYLDILAGGTVDLGFSSGVVTTGALRNATLPYSSGADVSIFAGLGDALATFADLEATSQLPSITQAFFDELVQSGREANQPGGDFSRGYAAIDALFPGSRANGADNPFAGDLNMSFSRIYTLAGGNISLLIPGGQLNVGLANPPPSFGTRDPSLLGIVAQRAGSVDIFTRNDVLVNQSRIFTLLGGDIAIWSTLGNIDAGRGAKSSLSAPPPTVIIDDSGKVTIDFSAAVAGSGIRTVVTGEGVKAGDVDLIAPAGFVNAGDAGIGSAGNLNIAAQTVVGLDNIQVGGVSTGVPAETGGLGAALSGATSAASSASNAGQTNVAASQAPEAAPISQNALTWLDVFIEGFGADSCAPNDTECLERQKQ